MGIFVATSTHSITACKTLSAMFVCVQKKYCVACLSRALDRSMHEGRSNAYFQHNRTAWQMSHKPPLQIYVRLVCKRRFGPFFRLKHVFKCILWLKNDRKSTSSLQNCQFHMSSCGTSTFLIPFDWKWVRKIWWKNVAINAKSLCNEL